jgi:hypothetical protein
MKFIFVLVQAIGAEKFECKEGPPDVVNTDSCCRTVKTFEDNVIKKCFSQFGMNPPRPGRGLRGTMSGHEVNYNLVQFVEIVIQLHLCSASLNAF